MSGDVPTPQVRNGLSVRHLGGVVSTPHVIRQEESPGSSMTKSRGAAAGPCSAWTNHVREGRWGSTQPEPARALRGALGTGTVTRV